MANSKQAIKRARQALKCRLHNQSQRSAMRTEIKKTLKAVAENRVEDAVKCLKLAVVALDRLAGRGLIHLNKAARIKGRLNRKVKAVKQAA